ncbi:alpha/beta fold hydrolase [Ruminiclostridium josui]|uniref:alpha/beta fold hydrolase n=2 Tax=Ruminiclostridium josui TaxID=1499 RepID=UPI0004671F0F|nr:alpha/beta hydrolase [Ruminiclostridium josui]
MKDNMSKFFIENNQRTVCYYVGGNPASEKIIFFLNGLYVGNKSWIKQQRYSYFRDNYKLLFLDYPGVGNSEEKENQELVYEDIITAIKNVLDREGRRETHLIGYSLGGMFGLWFTYQFPSYVNSLVLLNTGVRINIYIYQMIHGLITMIDSGVDLKNVYMFLYPWNHSEEYLEKTSDMEHITLENYYNYNRNTRSFKALLTALRNHPNLKESLEHITCPTLVVGSGNDKVFPLEYQKEIAAKIPNSTLHIIPSAGHSAFIENHQEMNALIEQHLKKFENTNEKL